MHKIFGTQKFKFYGIKFNFSGNILRVENLAQIEQNGKNRQIKSALDLIFFIAASFFDTFMNLLFLV